MYQAGLVSITFRQLKPEAIVKLVQESGLTGIEWGGDVHVPHGELMTAREVAKMTADHGLKVAAYGSYYRLNQSESEGLSFDTVLKTAVSLGAPSIRVWAGRKASADADDAHWTRVVEESLRIAEMAAKENIEIAYEYHCNTLTDTPESTARLLDAAQHPNLFTLWQPTNGETTEYCLDALEQVLPRLHNLHVFHWWPDTKTRHPLKEGEEPWARYLEKSKDSPRKDRYCLLEFVKDNLPEQFLADAKALKNWLEEI